MGMLRGALPRSTPQRRGVDRGRSAQGRRADTVAFLAELGFNRISVGIQDFDPAVQKAVNRIQSEAET